MGKQQGETVQPRELEKTKLTLGQDSQPQPMVLMAGHFNHSSFCLLCGSSTLKETYLLD